MPKAARKKWYAVRKGWDGPRIYSTWEETKQNVSRFPGAEFKSFTSEAQAEAWLQAGVGMSYNAESSQSSNGTTPPATPSTSQESVASSSAPIIVPNQGPPLLGPVPSADSHTSDPSDDSGSDSDMDTEVPGVPAVPPEGPAKPPTEPAVKLSAEQQHVLDLVQSRKSVFFTGSAGTGKSVLLREIIKWYEAKHINFAVTASTGIAAVNIGGCTLHSWAGIGLGKEPEEKLAGKILGQERWQRRKEREERIRKGLPPGEEEGDYYDKSNSRALKRWTSCQVLIIDEISMLDGKLFDKLEFVARALRKNEEPFGGIQLVLSGDFCQLPPVPDRDKGVEVPATFAFDAKCWDACVGKPVVLKKVFRQKDQRFVDMLNAMRFGQLNPDIIKAFRGLSRKVEYTDGLEPTDLFPTRNEVMNANAYRLRAIDSQPFQYDATDVPGYNSNGYRITREEMKRLLERLVAPESITLKVGAQVMLIKNIVQGVLVNGSLGRVISFLTTREAAAQGIELGIVETPKEGRRWQGSDARLGKQGPDWYREQVIPPALMNSDHRWPVVLFQTSSGERMERPMCCVPCSFEVNNADGEIEAKREQIPLILAWALSIHKSQGQTLQRVRVDLSRIFEKGQAYVALSRATNMDTLEVKGFNPIKIEAHPRVIEWTRANTDIHVPFGASQPKHSEPDSDEEYWHHV